MCCGDDLPDWTDGDVRSDRRHPYNGRAGIQDTNSGNRPKDTPTGDAKVEANAGTANEPPDNSDGQDLQEGHEFCPTWGQGYTATPDTHIPHHSASPSPHSHPPLDYESPRSRYESPRSRSARSTTRFDNDSPRNRGCDRHLVAA